MNITLRKITNECYNTDLDYFYKKVGNYAVKRNGEFISHFYYGNLICRVFLWSKRFYLYDCGYKNHRLTTAQLNYLKQFYTDKGYFLKEK